MVVKVLVAGTIVGFITGFFGVGGGFVVVPALVLALGFDMPEAVGTSLLVITINSVVALARPGGHHHGRLGRRRTVHHRRPARCLGRQDHRRPTAHRHVGALVRRPARRALAAYVSILPVWPWPRRDREYTPGGMWFRMVYGHLRPSRSLPYCRKEPR